MTDDMDRLIGAVEPVDAACLDGVEQAVWVRIVQQRDRVRIARVRAAAVAVALAVGGMNGGLMLVAPRPEPSEMRVFTVSAALSPLAGLDVRG